MTTANARYPLRFTISLSIALGALIACQASAEPPAGDTATAPVAAASADGAAAQPAAVAPASEATKALWAKHCASCHGAEGKADTKTAAMLKVKNLTDPQTRAGFDRDRMMLSTKSGVKKEGSEKLAMKGFADKLNDAEIAALVDLVYAFGQ